MAWIPNEEQQRHERLLRWIEDYKTNVQPKIIAERLAQGKPAKPPEDFLPLPVAIVLHQKYLKQAEDFVIRYTTLVNETKEFIAVDTGKLDVWITYSELVQYTDSDGTGGGYGKMLTEALKAIKEAVEGRYEKSISEFVRRRFLEMKFFKLHPSLHDIYDHKADNATNSANESLAKAEVERLLGNSEELAQEVERWRAHYEEIKWMY